MKVFLRLAGLWKPASISLRGRKHLNVSLKARLDTFLTWKGVKCYPGKVEHGIEVKVRTAVILINGGASLINWISEST